MDTKEFLNEEFLKQFKDSKEFGNFMEDLYKRGMETLFQGELETHLGYSKNEVQQDKTNYRNRFGQKKVKTQYGEIPIKVPGDRNAEFDPILIPKRSRMSEGIENLIISLHAKGMSNSDIEQQLNELYGFNVSTSTISLVTDKIINEIISQLAWQTGILANNPHYLFVN